MDKTAQKQSLLNKLKEKTYIPGISAEKFFNPEFKRVMEELRLKDDQIRSIASGEVIGESDPGEDRISLKNLIKSAKSNSARREYMSAVADLGKFHKKLAEIDKCIQELNFEVDKVHHEFLFKDLDDDKRKQLTDLKSRFAKRNDELIKEASIMDFFVNIGTKRGRALALWEKRYPKQIGKLKKDTNALLSKSEHVLEVILSSLKEMASARATRNIDSYVKGSLKISGTYNMYDKSFKEYYVQNVKGFLEKADLIPASSPDKKENMEVPGLNMPQSPTEQVIPDLEVKESPFLLSQKKEVTGPDTIKAPEPDMTPDAPVIPQAPKVPSNLGPPVPVSDTSILPPPMPEEKEESLNIFPKKAHAKFMNSLEALSNESPVLLANHIRMYAKSIQSTDMETSIKLFKVAKLIGE